MSTNPELGFDSSKETYHFADKYFYNIVGRFEHVTMTICEKGQFFRQILNFSKEINAFIVFSVLKNIVFHGFWCEIRQHKIVRFLSF